MSIDLQEPVSTIRTATGAATERAAEVAGHLVGNGAGEVARRSRRVRRQARRAARQAAEAVPEPARRAAASRRGRSLVALVLLAGVGAGIVLTVRRRRRSEPLAVVPDPFGTAVATAATPEHDAVPGG